MEYDKFNGLIALVQMEIIQTNEKAPTELLTAIKRAINQLWSFGKKKKGSKSTWIQLFPNKMRFHF